MSRPEPYIRPVTAADGPVLQAVHAAAFAPLGQAPWTVEAFESLLALPTTTALAVTTDTGIAAFIMGQATAEEAEIVTVATRPTDQGQGWGRILLDALLAHYAVRGVRKVFLEVMAENSRALALYRGVGFNKVGERANYYQDTGTGCLHTALVLAKELEYLSNASAVSQMERKDLDSVSSHRPKPK